VDRIIGEDGSLVKVVEPTLHDDLTDVPDEYWTVIQKGLGAVMSEEDGGTAAQGESFSDEFLDTYSKRMLSKSGTAEISASKADHIPEENTSWFITMLPKEDPEIVIVTCIPNGQSGAGASGPAIEDIVRFYMERKEGVAQENLVQMNGLTP
jgi:cell division protein FtsI/penicillin-binding protein 2